MGDAPGATPKSFRAFSAELDFPDLYPQAVMYAVFDSDPRLDLPKRVEALRNLYAKAKQEVDKGVLVSVAWDRAFDQIHGNQIYLAAPRDQVKKVIDETGETLFRASRTTVSIVGEEPQATTKKWLVSRSCMHENRPIAWCLPLELSAERPQTVVLTESGGIDLSAL